MPLYEYKCRTCAYQFERIERASSPQDGVCPDCGGVASRLLSSPAIQFKGSGWYITDYANGNGVKATESEKESATSESSKTGTENDTQTTAKPAKEEAAKASPKVA